MRDGDIESVLAVELSDDDRCHVDDVDGRTGTECAVAVAIENGQRGGAAEDEIEASVVVEIARDDRDRWRRQLDGES